MKEYELLLRKELFPHWIIYTLLFSIIVLSILKYRKEVVFLNLKSVLFNPPANISFSKDETSFFGLTHWLLLINYFLVSALATYMILIYYEYSDFWLVLLPSAYFIFQIFALSFAGLLSGELNRLRENILMISFTSHIIGLLFIPILFVWILNPHLSHYVINLLGIVFILLHFIRIIRGFFIALRNKVLWYYIILYLCGLEIWPMIVAYLLLPPVSID